MFESMAGMELLEGYKRAVRDTCRYSIFWSSLVSDSGLPYNNC